MSETTKPSQDNPQPKTVLEAGDMAFELTTPERCDPDSPDRCQHSKKINQCDFKSFKGLGYCSYHLALYDPRYRKQNRLKRYRLVQHWSRVADLAFDPDIKSLHEEIGMMRQLLETIWNQCHTQWDFEVKSQRIETMLEKITRMVVMSHKLESQLGKVMDENSLAILMDEVIKIVSDEIEDPTVLKRIGEKIAPALDRAKESAAAAATEKDK